jgi:hypothetical protein
MPRSIKYSEHERLVSKIRWISITFLTLFLMAGCANSLKTKPPRHDRFSCGENCPPSRKL